ncbi:MAG: UvrD-helicase domain-containing protein, partial [Leptospiraceae bacterium]|nr:UvrD-helicase domain-containing protein [Leptospiraceae bacterium]
MAGDRSILSGLNAEQREAVLNIQGPQLILAGAGSGKTRVITHRIAYMLERGIPARSIVAVTFTNKAAREMKARLSSMLTRAKMRGMVISTFHSLGNRILQQEIERLGYRLPFSIYT